MVVDLHGFTSDEAMGKIQMIMMDLDYGNYEEVEIITGNGFTIKGLVIDELNNSGFNWHHPNGNTGTIIVRA